MAQLALYVDDDLMKRLDRAARASGMSRSAFVAHGLRQQLDERLPESFFEVLGSWEDSRGPAGILRDIRKGPRDRRAHLR